MFSVDIFTALFSLISHVCSSFLFLFFSFHSKIILFVFVLRVKLSVLFIFRFRNIVSVHIPSDFFISVNHICLCLLIIASLVGQQHSTSIFEIYIRSQIQYMKTIEEDIYLCFHIIIINISYYGCNCFDIGLSISLTHTHIRCK